MLIGRRIVASSVAIAVLTVGLVGVKSDTAAQEAVPPLDPVSAQISEGFNVAAALKVRVAETFLAQGVVPRNRAGAGLTPNPADTQGRYIASIDIVQGEIIIAYGNAAHPSIAGKLLVLTPMLRADDLIAWQCGYATNIADSDANPMGANTSNSSTTVDPQYLPTACRSRIR